MAQKILKSWNLEVLRDIYSNICLNSQSLLGCLTCFAHRPFVGCPFFSSSPNLCIWSFLNSTWKQAMNLHG